MEAAKAASAAPLAEEQEAAEKLAKKQARKGKSKEARSQVLKFETSYATGKSCSTKFSVEKLS